MNNELKQIKLESVYKDAYTDRYRRLGYSLVSDISVVERGEDYSLLVFQRDRSQPNYARLAEIEKEVDDLCVKAKREQSVVDGTRLHRRAALGALMSFGIILMCIGLVLTVTGLVYSELYAAFAGWAGVFAGAGAHDHILAAARKVAHARRRQARRRRAPRLRHRQVF